MLIEGQRIFLIFTIMSSKSKNPKGGRKGWATTDQENWLKLQIPEFLRARAGGQRTLTPFRNKLYEEWFVQWLNATESSGAATTELPEDLSANEAIKLVGLLTLFLILLDSAVYSVSDSGSIITLEAWATLKIAPSRSIS
jgi:hypothetical protein